MTYPSKALHPTAPDSGCEPLLAGEKQNRMPIWVVTLALLAAGLLFTGAAISLWNPGMLAAPHEVVNGAVRVYAGYTASRDVGLAVALVALLALRAKRALGQLLALVGLIQVFDCVIDLAEHRWTVAPGVFVLGVLFVLAAARLCRAALWNRSAWL